MRIGKLRGWSPGVRGAQLVALAIVAAVFVIDLFVSDQVVLVALTIAAPLLCCLTASRRATIEVSVVTFLAGAVSLAISPPTNAWRALVPLAVLGTGSVFAVRVAELRERLHQEASRLQVLADVADVAHGGQPVPDMAQSLCHVLIPRLYDLCVIDLVGGDGRVQRLAGALSADDPSLLERLMARPPSPPDSFGSSAGAVAPAETLHTPLIEDAYRRGLAHDEADFQFLQELAIESAVIVPLIGHESPVGALILATRAPRARIDTSDVRFAETLAGRVALALYNAVLSQELSSTERQLAAILSTVDAGIIVRDRHGRLVYANPAAADILRLPDADAMRKIPSGQLMDKFDVYSEEGDPIDLSDLPGSRVLLGESPPSVIVRNVVKATGEQRWLLNGATAVRDADGEVLMVVNLIEDVTGTKRGEIAQRLLATTARELAQANELGDALQAIAEAAVPGMADWAGVDLVGTGGRIECMAIAHRDPEKVRLGRRLRTGWPVQSDEPDGLAAVIRTGEPQLIPDVTEEMLVLGARDPEHLSILRAVGLNSTMIVPITAGPTVLGALSFVSSTSRRFDSRDLELAGDLGRQIGVFISNAQLHSAQAHIAQTLQAGLIPDQLPVLEGWNISSAYRAAGRANEVGGDFYDIVRFDGGWAAIVGDVVGKGAEAAALTALARHTLAAIIESTGDVAYGLSVLNRRLRQNQSDFSTMCTIAAVRITAAGEATVYSAGHPLPVLRRPTDGVEAVGRTSPMLGFLDDIELVGTEVRIDPGDQLILYTDGVLDAVGAQERFGEERLLETVGALAGSATADPAGAIIAAIDSFLEGEQNDDIAVMSLTRAAVDQRTRLIDTRVV